MKTMTTQNATLLELEAAEDRQLQLIEDFFWDIASEFDSRPPRFVIGGYVPQDGPSDWDEIPF